MGFESFDGYFLHVDSGFLGFGVPLAWSSCSAATYYGVVGHSESNLREIILTIQRNDLIDFVKTFSLVKQLKFIGDQQPCIWSDNF